MKGSDYVGKTFTSNKCGDFVVTDYKDYDNVTIKFIATGSVVTTQLYHIKDGGIKDRLFPSVYGVGMLGDEEVSQNGVKLKEYKLWRALLGRCYNTKTKSRSPSYVGCSVSDNFKYYPYFKDWCSRQIGFGRDGFELDKDILVKGNKIYSEGTCCFVPKEINLLFCKSNSLRGCYPIGVNLNKLSGKFKASVTYGNVVKSLGCYDTSEEAFQAYKEAKELRIKEVANKWKDQIDLRVYEALMKYEVHIDD